MRIGLWIIGVGIGISVYSATLSAIPTVVPDRIPCFSYLETNFFAEPIVSQALSLYNVRQEMWVPIHAALVKKSSEVPQRMKNRTAFMVPNPLEYPMQREAAARILKEVLFEVFIEVMRDFRSYETPNVALVFDYIFTQQLPNFIKCFGPEVQTLKPKFD